MKKDYGPPSEWESKPFPEDSGGDVLCPYFQNKALNKFSDSLARTPGAIWRLLLKPWYLWIFRRVSYQCSSTWESWVPHASIWLGRSCCWWYWKSSYCLAWETAWHCRPRLEQWNVRLPMSEESSAAWKCLPTSSFFRRFFPPAGRGGEWVVALFYIPFAAFCSFHLCFSYAFIKDWGCTWEKQMMRI